MKTWWLGGRGHSPMQHLWQPFVSGILVVKANLLRRENSQAVVTAVLKEPDDDVYNKGSQPELLFFFLPLQQSVMMLDSDSKKTAQRECSNIRKVVTLSQNKIKQKKDSRACWSHLGKILSGKRWVWNWAARPGFLSWSNSPMRLWEYSWKVFPAAEYRIWYHQLCE